MQPRIHSAPGDAIVSHQPVSLRRYGGFTRANHWLTALCMIVLVLSGFAFFHPSLYGLTALFGGGQTTRWLHPIVGVVMALSFLGLFIQMWRLNLPAREDLEWTLKIGDVMRGNDDNLPALGKYNAGQKLVFWAFGVLILALLVTGVMIWEQYFAWMVSIPVRRVAVTVHALSAIGIVLVFILHVYAALWVRGTLSAMTRGTVSGGWAWRHHRKWLRELARRDTRDNTGGSD
ncbi:MAG: formate dehydrogenase subunit gamma [Xanthomonadales bacterium]|nr:formate dehydrogenase subunit gamma [Xanthomonadales bacterium]